MRGGHAPSDSRKQNSRGRRRGSGGGKSRSAARGEKSRTPLRKGPRALSEAGDPEGAREFPERSVCGKTRGDRCVAGQGKLHPVNE
jgi:hypothetical protein